MAQRKKKAPAKRKAPVRRKRTAGKTVAPSRKWSARVSRTSDALDLEGGVFKERDPKKVARSLKRSAEHSKRRKAGPFQSAMSMLNFYINRGGRNLPAAAKRVLVQAKEELRRLYGRD